MLIITLCFINQDINFLNLVSDMISIFSFHFSNSFKCEFLELNQENYIFSITIQTKQKLRFCFSTLSIFLLNIFKISPKRQADHMNLK